MKKTGIILIIVASCAFWTGSAVYAQEGKTAKAVIKGTVPGSALSGQVDFSEENGGIRVTAHLSNVPAGNHGFHVHEKGSCDDNGNAAGGHFNPDGHQHGLLVKDSLSAAHAGDLGNIEIDAGGNGNYSAFLEGLSLSGGKYDVMGKAVIVHEKADDFGQPTGNAGGRIGCGIIELVE